MLLLKVFSVICFTAVCAAQDVNNVSEVYGKTTPTVPTTVYDPPKPSLLLQSQRLDVFPSEKVEMSCSISGSSDWTFIWLRNGELLLQDSDPALTITAQSQADSGHYVCKGRHKTKGVTTKDSNSLVLKVNANKPKPKVVLTSKFNKVFLGESVTCKCMVDVSSGWDYLWYHNGNEIQRYNNNTYIIDSVDHSKGGQYHCKAKRGKGAFYNTEPSETITLQVFDPPTPVLKVQTPWLDVFQTEIVELSCVVEGNEWEVIWYKDGMRLQEDLDLEQYESFLNITSATQIHQGSYTCEVQLKSRGVTSGSSNTAKVTVYGSIPKPTLSKNPDLNPMYVGETVTFTCKVDVSSGWKYKWYKDGTSLSSTNEALRIHLGLSDGGKYSCEAIRGAITSNRSEGITQDVLEIPVPSLKLSTQWHDVFPTEIVALHCEMPSSPDWTYTWSRDDQLIQADDTTSFDRATLLIKSSSDSHAGQYKCKGHLSGRSVSSNSSSGLSLTVYATKPSVTLTQYPEYNVMFAEESVSFSCHINVSSGWEYLWYKDGENLQGESLDKYSISTVVKTNSGSYKCHAKRGRNPDSLNISSQDIHLEIEEEKPKPSVTQQPDVDMVYTGESVSFKCTLDISSGWEYIWYKDGVHLTNNSASFSIHNATSLDKGTYSCMARRDKTGFITEHSDGRILRVSEIPVPMLKRGSQWLDVFPTESVKLICGMQTRSDWTYTWYRDGKQVHAVDAVSFDPDGTTLSIGSASASHRGQYSCSGNLKSRPVRSSHSPAVTLDVYDTKPSIVLMQTPAAKLMHTGDSVSFNCHINVSSGWDYQWYKDGNSHDAPGSNYTISSLVTSNTGSYTCQAKRGENPGFFTKQAQALKLVVAERPKASIVLLTGWSEVFSTDSLMLKCEVQKGQDMWNYTWFKAGKKIDLLPSEKHAVTPQDDPEQSLYFCRGIRTGRPSYSKDSSNFPTKNLLLKRRLLLSISGCLFFGIIAVFIGCIVLRFIRKPDDEYEKPEEAELFLTMAQLKDRGDAPCPMVDFITDEALKVPPKEGDENGTICSESTPLPITVQEDQAVATGSLDTAESNGGLVSFKQ